MFKKIKKILNNFWKWYENNYALVLFVTSFLFLLQAFHLYWLFTDIILQKITGHSHFIFPPQGIFVYVLIDYIEIPTHLSLMLIYIYNMRKSFKISDLMMFIFIQLHWLHIFWITDQVVLERLTTHGGLFSWNTYLAWIAILIDYLELPIMADQLRKLYSERKQIFRKLGLRHG